jgi:hypothetical protein
MHEFKEMEAKLALTIIGCLTYQKQRPGWVLNVTLFDIDSIGLLPPMRGDNILTSLEEKQILTMDLPLIHLPALPYLDLDNGLFTVLVSTQHCFWSEN